MKNIEKWVLVANSSTARVFKMETIHKLTEIKTFVHPESRMLERDLVDSAPGDSFESWGNGRHPIEPPTKQKVTESVIFARMLSDYLQKELIEPSHFQLYIVASPNFLGILRQSLPDSILNIVTKEINKDIVRASTSEILEHIIT